MATDRDSSSKKEKWNYYYTKITEKALTRRAIFDEKVKLYGKMAD